MQVVENGLTKEQEILRRHIMNLLRMKKLVEVQRLLRNENDMESWGRDAQAKVCFSWKHHIQFCFSPDLTLYFFVSSQLGSRLIELLIESAFVQPPVNQLACSLPDIRPAFIHTFKTVSKEDGY